MFRKRAFITGITGQDGSYLAELLLTKGYEVHGLRRRHSTFGTERIDHLYVDPHDPEARMFLHYGDITDGGSLDRLLHAIKPHEVYNLAAQSHVGVSFLNPVYTSDANAIGTLRILESVRGLDYPVRFYQASSSEMFGSSPPPQDESTPFHPRNPYGVSKVYAYWQTVNHREAFGLFAANGILFNHESPRRGETFVTRKITRAATRIKLGLQDKVFLGNLDAERDWGFAGDYAEAMWLMLQADEPDDFVIATGERRSVRDLCKLVFSRLDLDWEDHVEVDPIYLRPSEVDALEGDASKARAKLGWKPKVSIEELTGMMVDADMVLAQRERTLADAGLVDDPTDANHRFGSPES
jgi:GDPmannose 4,6-dehydratase